MKITYIYNPTPPINLLTIDCNTPTVLLKPDIEARCMCLQVILVSTIPSNLAPVNEEKNNFNLIETEQKSHSDTGL